eukprot:TRINITY_DN51899_c1_g1_i4.p2 TRINITY_DN51899_c1_g1~~TRINITY_DN51899_c1_g1_i4.p2  ORF type:complete len:183 (-),score=14.00 TRINITY_DN51899_c1_g1_i4:133-681(-)
MLVCKKYNFMVNQCRDWRIRNGQQRVCFQSQHKLVCRSQDSGDCEPKLEQKLKLCTTLLFAGALCFPSSSIADEQLYQVALLGASQAALLVTFLRPLLAIGQLLMISRIVLTWYPQIDTSKLPWALSYIPTEPILSVTRKVIKPVGGVDVTPIVWFAFLSFSNEILIGPQGILNLIQEKGGI